MVDVIKRYYGLSDKFDEDFRWSKLQIAMLDLGLPPSLFESFQCHWPGEEVVNEILYFAHDWLGRDEVMRNLLCQYKFEKECAVDRAKRIDSELAECRATISDLKTQLEAQIQSVSLPSLDRRRVEDLEKELEELRCELSSEKAAAAELTKQSDAEIASLKEKLATSEKDRENAAAQNGRERQTEMANIATEFKRMETEYKGRIADLQKEVSERERREADLKDKQLKERANFNKWKKIYEPAKAKLDEIQPEYWAMLDEHLTRERQLASLRETGVQTERLGSDKGVQTESDNADTKKRKLEEQKAGGEETVVAKQTKQLKHCKSEIRALKEKTVKTVRNHLSRLSDLEHSLVEHLHNLAEPFHVQVERSFLHSFLRSVGEMKGQLVAESNCRPLPPQLLLDTPPSGFFAFPDLPSPSPSPRSVVFSNGGLVSPNSCRRMPLLTLPDTPTLKNPPAAMQPLGENQREDFTATNNQSVFSPTRFDPRLPRQPAFGTQSDMPVERFQQRGYKNRKFANGRFQGRKGGANNRNNYPQQQQRQQKNKIRRPGRGGRGGHAAFPPFKCNYNGS